MRCSPEIWNARCGWWVSTGQEQVVYGGRKRMVQQSLGYSNVLTSRGKLKAEVDDTQALKIDISKIDLI